MASEAGGRIESVEERHELRIAVRIVDIRLAPVIYEAEHNVHCLVHPGPTTLINAQLPEGWTEIDSRWIGVA